MNAAWGSDYGIYYGITDDFLKHPQLFRPYSGWGTSYVYFPVLYIVTAIFQGITGLGLDFLMPRVAPIFGGLTVPLLYLIVKEIFGAASASPFPWNRSSLSSEATTGRW
mgnify:CR=1 FL=1